MAPRLRAEEWRLHPTYCGELHRMIDTPERLYILSYNQRWERDGDANLADNLQLSLSLFACDHDSKEMVWLNSANKLSSSIVVCAEYDKRSRGLLIAYANGDLDILYDDGRVKNIPGLKLAGSEYQKHVNAIEFDATEEKAYLATDFGFLLLNMKSGEIETTVNLGRRVESIAPLGDRLLLGLDNSLWIGSKSSRHLEDFRTLNDFDALKRVIAIAPGRALVWSGDGWQGRITSLEVLGEGISQRVLTESYICGMERSERSILVSAWFFLHNINEDLSLTYIPKREEEAGGVMTSWNVRDFFVNHGIKGLSAMRYGADEKWSVTEAAIHPNAANCYKVTSMVYTPEYGMLLRNHGIDFNFNSLAAKNPDMLSGYDGLQWRPLNCSYLTNLEDVLHFYNPSGIAIDPQNRNHIYSGSTFDGLMRLDLEHPENSFRIGRQGDDAAGKNGFVAVHKDFSFSSLSSFTTPAFDSRGNMFAAWYDYDAQKAGRDNLELLLWTPEDRKAITSAANYRPMERIAIKGVMGSIRQRLSILKCARYKDWLLYSNSLSKDGKLLFIDTKQTAAQSDDDDIYEIPFIGISDTDGNHDFFYAPRFFYEEPTSEKIWVGTESGVFNFSIKNFIEGEFTVTRPKVARNDGTQLADYLLNGVSVNAMEQDSEGRKWFATSGAGIVVTTADGMEIIRSYTTDNSALPNNTVYSLCYNPKNGSMMISTDSGLAELFLPSSAAKESGENSLKAYPNPVRADFYGFVKIEGVPDGGLVKVLNSAGQLVKELGYTSSGEIEWNLSDLYGHRVRAGIYHILSIDERGEAKRTKILVID